MVGVSLLDVYGFVRQRRVGRLEGSVATELTAVEDAPQVAVIEFFIIVGAEEFQIEGTDQRDHEAGYFG